ncbi:MAG TPA: hypothetical protein VJ952_08280 [Opitutales bacterium]|nr:hypothetical protein [Opitutales bacterium]
MLTGLQLGTLYNLKRDRGSGWEKPYKPALLLALIDLIENGRQACTINTRTPMPREQKSHIALDSRPGFPDVPTNKARQASQRCPNWWATFLVEAAER